MSIVKWIQHSNSTFDLTTSLRDIWHPLLYAKESCFAWQVIYRIAATNVRRFQRIPRVQSEKQCARCKVDQELIVHFLWGCPKVARVSEWVTFLIPITSQDPEQVVNLVDCQVLIGTTLSTHTAPPDCGGSPYMS